MSASIADVDRPTSRRLWRDHVVVVGTFQILEHAPFFARLRNLIFIPGAIAYAYIHAGAVVWALLTLNTVSQSSATPSQPKLGD